MERSILGAIFGSLFGISALGGLAFIGAGSNPMPGKPEGNWRLLDPVAYENITIPGRKFFHAGYFPVFDLG